MNDLISRQAAIEVADAVWCVTGDVNVAKVWDQLRNLPPAQPETTCSEIPNNSDLISRQAAVDAINEICDRCGEGKKYNGVMCGACYMDGAVDCIEALPPAEPEPLSAAYTKAVWTWLLDYQIKAAELKGRYTPYEVLSLVANDWRKEHE